MSTVWFTADLHLGHATVAALRGYENPADHDRMILDNIAASVYEGDSLWILGDLSSGGSVGQRAALQHLDNLSMETGVALHLIAGNHDGIHPLHRNAHKWDEAYRDVFDSVQPFARRKIAGQKVWLSHFPWRGGGDHTERERYETVRLNDDGTSWLLHGHTHSPAPIDRERRMIQVGVDAWNRHPVSINTIAEMIEDTL